MLAFGRASWLQKLVIGIGGIPVVGPRIIAAGLRRKINPAAVTLPKVRNFILANREAAARAVRVRSLPYVLNLDTINGCNLTCPFCPTGTRQLDRKKTRLPADSARSVIDAVQGHALAVRFYNWGEPFLNPDIWGLIRHARDRGLHTTVSSNMSIRVEDLAGKILDSGLDHLHVSLDGIAQESLEAYRRKADAELVIGNLRDLLALRRSRKAAGPRVEIVFLVFRQNEHEIPRLRALGRELGADAVRTARAFIYHPSYVPADPAYAPAQSIFPKSCHYLYSELMVEADGHVSPCCTNTSSRFDVGSIADLDDLRAFWNNDAFLAMRTVNAGAKPKNPSGQPRETLCDHCRYVGKDFSDPARLSPLPPSMAALGQVYDHGLDMVAASDR